MKRETCVFLALCREKAFTIREFVNEIREISNKYSKFESSVAVLQTGL